MVRVAPLLLILVLAGTSRADEPTPSIRYEELFLGDPGERWSPADGAVGLRWETLGSKTIDAMAELKQPIDADAATVDVSLRAALETLLQDRERRQPIEPQQRIESSGAGRAVVLERDDRGFLDVVLVGSPVAFHCTGILIAPAAVLTAAHCAPAAVVGFGQRASRLLARVEVVDSIRHPVLDVALLRLERAVPLPVRPRRLRVDRDDPTSVVRLVGFGVDDIRHPTSFGVKRRVDAVANGWGCDRGRARSARCRPDAELLLTAVGGADTCRGDSGGPVLEPTPDGYRLMAITSRSTASGGAACGRGGIYVRVDVIDAWLTSLLEQRP